MASTSKYKRPGPPPILDGKFFKIITEEQGNVTAECQKCIASNKTGLIKGKLHSTSNFITHLQKVHAKDGVYEEYQNYLKTEGVDPKRQKTLTASYPVHLKQHSKTKAEALLVDYVVETMSPLSIVDHPAFSRLLKEFPANVDVPSRNTLVSRINDRFNDMVAKLKSVLSTVSWVCCTADCWKSKSGNKSYLGVTCHWLNEEFERVSAALAIKRFKGSHTFDRIADMLRNIFSSFDISTEKIVFVVTDNGSNFVKAFKEFGIIEVANEEDESDEEDEAILEYDDIVDSGDESNVEPPRLILPNHVRCASHTLNLIVSKDLLNVQPLPTSETGRVDNKKSTKAMLKTCISKCQAFWNKVSRSSQIEEQILDVTKRAILKPNATRWNSLYDAITRLLSFKDILAKMFDIAGVVKLNQTDVEFLEDYITAVTPVANALDKLQGEHALYFGSLAPVISSVKNQLAQFTNTHSERKYVSSLGSALKTGLEKRFKNILEFEFDSSSHAFLAAISTPYFKLRWLPTDRVKEFRDKFTEEARKWNNVTIQDRSESPTEIPVDTFFNFDNTDSERNSQNQDVALECMRYFNDKSIELKSLSSYPTIKKMFHRFNTGLPSSAPVERLFSYAGIILRPHRAKMSDDHFEKLVILKINAKVKFLC